MSECIFVYQFDLMMRTAGTWLSNCNMLQGGRKSLIANDVMWAEGSLLSLAVVQGDAVKEQSQVPCVNCPTQCLHSISSDLDHLWVYDLDTTHRPIPPQTNAMPIHVSRSISLPSAYHSPRTVNRNANEFVIGTVSDSSAWPTSKKNHTLPVKLHNSGIA